MNNGISAALEQIITGINRRYSAKTDLSGDVDNSQETRWQHGKDMPEATRASENLETSPMRKVSGSEVSRTQTSGSSEPPAQNTFPGVQPESPTLPESREAQAVPGDSTKKKLIPSGIVRHMRQTEELKRARNYENIAEITLWVERDDRPDLIEVVAEYEVEEGGYTGNSSAGHSEYVGDQAIFISAHTLDGREITLSETEIEEGIDKLFGRNKR